MTRCAFLRGQTVLSCFVLCIAIASGKKGQTGRSFDTVQAAVAALQRSAHRDPTSKPSGRTLPIFQPKLSTQSKAQPMSLSGLDVIQAFLRPGNKEHHGIRRVQDACASQRDTLYSCLPDDDCKGCYQGQFTSLENEDMWCGVIEHNYCEVGTTCACGSECEAEAENYYQCILELAACENDANCADAECEHELINLLDCDKGIGNVCSSCVSEAVYALFDTSDTAPCTDIQSTICASSDSCGCGQCEDELVLFFECGFFYCPDLSCTPTTPPTPATPTTPPGPPTSPPTHSDPCYVCGDPNLTVDPSETVEIETEVRKCVDVQVEYETSQLVSPFQCSILIEAVTASCNCQSPPPASSSRAPEEPQTDSSSGPPQESTTNSSSAAPEESKSNSSLAALAALVAIPLIAVIVYLLIKHNKADAGSENKKAPISRAAYTDEFNETPPATPSTNRHHARTPDSHYYQTDRSASPSSRSDEDYMYGHRSVAVAPAAFQNSGGGWSASYTVRPHEDHHQDTVGEVSAGSGCRRDPSGVPAGVASCYASAVASCYASPVGSLRNTGGYLPQQTSQCRKIAGEEVLPMVFIADEFEA